MPASTYLRNKWLDSLRNQSFAVTTVYASLHTADPGDTGASEVSGGSPAYARKSMTWNAASAGNLDASNSPVFDVPASTTVRYVGFWDASTSGNYLGSGTVTTAVFASQGTYTLLDADFESD